MLGLASTYQLRWYQSEAVTRTWDWLYENPGNPVIVLPTGAGKSLVIAQLAVDALGFGARALILAHRKELIEQNASKVRSLLPGVSLGIFSAGLRQYNADADVVCAGIQSCWKKAEAFGHRSLILIDEAHLVSTKDDGMYRAFLADIMSGNPSARVVGLTATPYRTGEGMLCGPERLFQGVSYEAKIPRLIEGGYLCKITSQAAEHSADTSGLHVRGGEFIAGEVEQLFGDSGLVRAACAEIVAKTHGRKSIICFAAGVGHAHSVAAELERLTSERVGVVTGDSNDLERAAHLASFKDGRLRWLVNVDVLTTGFDAPNIDAIAVLRATCSPGLFAQICGRGFRLHPAKQDCLILDFGQNVERHGPLDSENYGQTREKKPSVNGEAPSKICPNCHEVVLASRRECACGWKFPPPQLNHDHQAGSTEILATYAPSQKWLVEEITFRSWTNAKKGTRTLRVDYVCQLDGAEGNLTRDTISEWVCLEHEGFPKRKAFEWWTARCAVAIGSIDEAVDAWKVGAVGHPEWIEARKEGRFYRITKYGPIEIPQAEDYRDELNAVRAESEETDNEWAAWGSAEDIPF